ncbi:MAG: maltotransferase domain-containing protein, partial [Bryocella sp.]
MKPAEGRCRVVIEEIQPQIDGGRYPAKRVLGDTVEVTAAIFGDGHDHVAARLTYRSHATGQVRSVRFTPLNNDVWSAKFVVDHLGAWSFSIEAWIDHFDTWVHDLFQRLAAQPDPQEPTQQVTPQDIPLALRTGAIHVDGAAERAVPSDSTKLKRYAQKLRSMADEKLAHYPVSVLRALTEKLTPLLEAYPDTQFATKHPVDLPLWVDRERAQFSAWYELFPRSAGARAGGHGTLRDVEAQLPRIAAMGFDIVYMPPIHPIGEQFRKGKNNAV